MTEKTLFKLWVEKDQIARLEAVAKEEKTSVAWAIRRAIDLAYPAMPVKGGTKKKK